MCELKSLTNFNCFIFKNKLLQKEYINNITVTIELMSCLFLTDLFEMDTITIRISKDFYQFNFK